MHRGFHGYKAEGREGIYIIYSRIQRAKDWLEAGQLAATQSVISFFLNPPPPHLLSPHPPTPLPLPLSFLPFTPPPRTRAQAPLWRRKLNSHLRRPFPLSSYDNARDVCGIYANGWTDGRMDVGRWISIDLRLNRVTRLETGVRIRVGIGGGGDL